MIFYGISELMLAIFIQRYDKKNLFISRLRDLLKFYRLSGTTIYGCINIIYQFIKPFLDNKKSIFEEYGAFQFRLWLIYRSIDLSLNVRKRTFEICACAQSLN